MNNINNSRTNKENIVRVSKKDKGKLKGATNWAALVAEERKENSNNTLTKCTSGR